MKITIDFEGRSELSLKDHGSWLYSRHPSTEILCVGWGDGEFEEGQWVMGQANPTTLFRLIAAADVIESHNTFFEFAVWHNICLKRMDWPAIPEHKWRCTLAKARAAGLPGNLGDAGRVAGLAVVKDEREGSWAMKKMARPRKATKNDDSKWHEGKDDWDKMLTYNMTDVRSEIALSRAIPDLSAMEQRVHACSERMNRRGFSIDVAGCQKAVNIAGEYALRLTKEFQDITGLETAGQRAKFIVWLTKNGVEVTNTQADTLDEILAKPAGTIGDGNVPPEVRRAIQIVRSLGQSSIKKYRALLNYADTDGRVRGCFLYHGAHTGRWTASGPQPQNFKRDCPWDMDEAWRAINEGSLDLIELWYGDPLAFLSAVTRGAICAPEGRQFYSGDLKQIEPRVLFWQAGEKAGLDVFRSGEDIYLVMASTIYNRTIVKSKENDEKRFLGKHAILALGYGAGYIKFLMHCRELGAPAFSRKQICELVPAQRRNSLLSWILHKDWKRVKKMIPDADRRTAEELVLTKYIVDKYRERYRKTVCKLWDDMEDAFRLALRNPGKMYPAGKVAYYLSGRVMKCHLPSGRVFCYWDPREDDGRLSHMMWSEGRWQRVDTYGGKLSENSTQAISRDVMAEGMLRLGDSVYEEIDMTVHDDVTSEVDEGIGDLDEFLALLSVSPAWAPDLPVETDGYVGKRYHK